MVFTSEIEIRLDWSEMDLFGHVNNVAYFKYVQSARVNYLEQVGINTSNPEDKISFAVAASSCEFKKPLYFPGTIKLHTSVSWIKNTSMQLEHIIYDQQGGISAQATDVIVLFDYSKQTKVRISDETRKSTGLPY